MMLKESAENTELTGKTSLQETSNKSNLALKLLA